MNLVDADLKEKKDDDQNTLSFVIQNEHLERVSLKLRSDDRQWPAFECDWKVHLGTRTIIPAMWGGGILTRSHWPSADRMNRQGAEPQQYCRPIVERSSLSPPLTLLKVPSHSFVLTNMFAVYTQIII